MEFFYMVSEILFVAFLKPFSYISLKKPNRGTLYCDMYLKMVLLDFFLTEVSEL